MIRLILCLVVGVLMMAGQSALAQNPVQDQSYVIQAEDVLTITVRDVTEASGDFLVRRDGYISHPLAGELKVAGLTITQATKTLTDALKKELRDPQVAINVKESTSNRIYVLGAVRTSGVLDYKPKWRLTEVIAAAGGLSSAPERSKAILYRVGKPTQIIDLKKVFVLGDDASNVPVMAGDVINVQSDVTTRVDVIGQVTKPGTVEVLEGQGVVEALAAAGGATPLARLSGAKLVRHGKEIPVDLYAAVTKAQTQLDVTVQEGDTLYIPTLVNRVAVIGSVAHPGPLDVPDGQQMTLTLAIAIAGGPIPGAKTDLVNIMRTVDGKSVTTQYDYKLALKGKNTKDDPLLQNNDVVLVPQSGKASLQQLIPLLNTVYVFGYLSHL